MLTIKTEEINAEITELLSSNKQKTLPDNAIIMTARDNETLLAAGALILKDYKVYLDCIITKKEFEKDSSLKTGLAKSLLNLADLRGIKTVYGNSPELTDLYKLLRFTKNNLCEFELGLEDYFICKH